MWANLFTGSVRSAGLSSLMRVVGVATRLLPIAQPTMLVGPGASARLGQAICDFDHTRVLIVTDPVVAKLGLMEPMLQALKAGGMAYVVFDKMQPDAPIPLIEKGVALFKSKGCDAIVAFGGGSVLDAAKAIALCATNNKHPAQLAGYFKGLRSPAPIYAVPITDVSRHAASTAALRSDKESSLPEPRKSSVDPS